MRAVSTALSAVVAWHTGPESSCHSDSKRVRCIPHGAPAAVGFRGVALQPMLKPGPAPVLLLREPRLKTPVLQEDLNDFKETVDHWEHEQQTYHMSY